MDATNGCAAPETGEEDHAECLTLLVHNDVDEGETEQNSNEKTNKLR